MDEEARERFGIGFRHVEGEDLATLQPGLSPRFVKGTFVPVWKTVADPKLLGKAVWAYAQSMGARFEMARIDRVSADGDGVTLTGADCRARRARHLVVAAGADGVVRLLTPLGTLRVSIETQEVPITSLAVSADNSRIAAASIGGSITIIDRSGSLAISFIRLVNVVNQAPTSIFAAT